MELYAGRSKSVCVCRSVVPTATFGDQERLERDDWTAILAAKEAINKVLEEQRSQGEIKGSLGAEVASMLIPRCLNHCPS